MFKKFRIKTFVSLYGFSLIILFLLLIFPISLFADVKSPIIVDLSISDVLTINQVVDVTCTVNSIISLQNADAKIILPDGAKLLSGTLVWEGDIEKDNPVSFTATIMFTEPGNWAIKAVAKKVIDEENWWGDVKYIYLNIGDTFSRIGFSKIENDLRRKAVTPKDYQLIKAQLPRNKLSDPKGEKLFILQNLKIGPDEKSAENKINTSAGTITVGGYFYYWTNDNQYVPAKYVTVYLYDSDFWTGDDYLGSDFTDNNGYYEIGPVDNNDPESGTQDIYISVFTASTKRIVENYNDEIYYWDSDEILDNVDNGFINYPEKCVPNGNPDEGAMWIFQTLRDGFAYPPNDPGCCTVEWENDGTGSDSPCGYGETYYCCGEDVHLIGSDCNLPDVILHEAAHNYMWNIYGDWMPTTYCPSPHYINAISHINCAWTEGWANFYPLAVYNDTIFHANGWQTNLETPTGYWEDGDAVEGRVAGALWDIYDSNNDGYDIYSFGFDEIWDVIYNQKDDNFSQYWSAWKSRGHPKHYAVASIYQNTIYYDNAPFISGLPNRTLDEDSSWDNALDLWSSSSDIESSDSELSFSIVENSNPNCGVSIDSDRYIDIDPINNWFGNSNVTIEVSDMIKNNTDIFKITVEAVNDAPVVSDIPDQSVPEGGTFNIIHLDNYVSDKDNTDSEITWTYSGNDELSVTIDDDRIATIGIPHEDWNGSETITFTATDPGDESDSDPATFTVTGLNDAPIITSIADTVTYEDSLYSYQVVAVDVDVSDSLQYSLTVFPIGMSINSSGLVSWLPDDDDVGDTVVTILVTDDSAAVDTQSYILQVVNINDYPVITSLDSVGATEDIYFSYHATVSDVDDTLLSWTINLLPSWLSSQVDSVYGTPLEGNLDTTFRMIVSDGELRDTMIVEVTVTPVNDPPVIISADSVGATEDVYFRYVATATDAEDSTLSWIFDQLPCWLSFNADSIYGTPAEGNIDTSFRAIVSDGELKDTSIVDVNVTPVNDAPMITSSENVVATEDIYFVYTVLATDPEDSTLEYTFDWLSSWLSSDSDSVYGLPLEGDLDTLFRVIVSDGKLTDTLIVSIDVTPVNDAPYLVQPLDSVMIDEDDFGAIVIHRLEDYFADVDISDYLAFTDMVLDAGLDSVIIGNPSSMNLTGWSSSGFSGIVSIKRSVIRGDINAISKSELRLASKRNERKARTGSVFSSSNIASSSKSSWISRNIESDTTSLIVYPTEDFNGGVRIVVTATDDSSDYVSDTLLLTIVPINDPPVLAALQDTFVVEEDDKLQLTLSAYDVDGDTLTFDAESDTNAVIVVVTDTILTLIPDENWNGSTGITVIVSDGDTSDSGSFTLMVVAVNDTPTVANPIEDVMVDEDTDDTLIDLTGVFDDIDIGTNGDSLRLNVVNDNPDLLSAILDGNTLRLDYLPDQYGSASIVVTATDNDSAGVMDTFSVVVNPVNDVPYLVQPLDSVMIDEDDFGVIVIQRLEDYFTDVDIGDHLTFADTVLDAGLDSVVIGSPNNINLTGWSSSGFSDIVSIKRSVIREDTKAINKSEIILASKKNERKSRTGSIFNLSNIANSSKTSRISLNIEPDTTSLVVYLTENFNGDVRIVVIATDDSSDYVSDTLLLMVEPINDPPVLATLPDTSFAEDDTLSFSLTEWYPYVEDLDNPDSTLAWDVGEMDSVNSWIKEVTIFFTAPSNWFGKDTLSVMVSDSAGLWDTTGLFITVLAINDSPVISDFPDSVIFSADSSVILDLNDYVNDVDDPDSALYWSITGYDSVIVALNDTTNMVELSAHLSWSGQETLIFTVTDDSSASDSDTLLVHVTPYVGINGKEVTQIPKIYFLSQNYPNPFNPTTTIIYGIPKISHVEVKIYDLLGREVTTLINEKQEAKYYKIIWDAKDRFGNDVSSGMYFYRIVAISGNRIFMKTKKLLLLR